ncbi:hypothetical protein ABZ897_38070 [Nonomuraea sp. NPDC046802]|uniref:hypothetical protein n=1 Tax=Nonomuraea sp. NPDC046802 TaxID=3154919 RepID=UPI0033E31944
MDGTPLDGLERIDWARSVDCWGDRGEVPKLLHGLWGTPAHLIGDRDDLGSRAVDELRGRLVVVGDGAYCIRDALSELIHRR